MSFFAHDGVSFHFADDGAGLPVVLLHGLGGDVQQPRGLMAGLPGIRLITLDFRAHGETNPLGPDEKIRIAKFAEDVRALLDQLSLERPVVGGISLGAAVALRFALSFPTKLRALILSRPAWLEGPNLFNQYIYREISALIRQHGPATGKALFRESRSYAEVLDQSSDAARSLLGQFDASQAERGVCRLERLPADAPIENIRELAGVGVPTLVLANRLDPIHPFAFGETLAREVPGATFGELTPKSDSTEQHAVDFRQQVATFLHHHFPTEV